MPHLHWVTRQNKLEIPNDKDEVNTREIHKCDGQAHDPDTMVAPLTPKPTRKAEALAKAPPTIASSREEDAALKELSSPLYRCANGILETKAKTKAPQRKPRPHVSTQISMRRPPHPNHTPTHHTKVMGEHATRENGRPTDTQADT